LKFIYLLSYSRNSLFTGTTGISFVFV